MRPAKHSSIQLSPPVFSGCSTIESVLRQASNWIFHEHYDAIVDRVGRITLAHANLTEHLAGLPDASRDRYILLDAQDWMTDAQLSALWTQITRTARPGARILFRTAGEADIIPGRIPDAVLSRWAYQAEASKAFTAQDRSAIYGGVHLYILQDA